MADHRPSSTSNPTPFLSPPGRRRKIYLSIRLIVAGVATIITGAAVITMGFITEHNTRRLLTSEIQTRLLLEARHLALVSSTELLSDFPELGLQPMVTGLKARQPELEMVMIVNHEGRIKSHGDLRLLGTDFKLPPDLVAAPGSPDTPADGVVLASEVLLVASAPALGPTGEILGNAYVGLRRDYIKRMVAGSRIRDIAVMGLCLVLAVSLTLVIMTRLLRPIAALKQGLQRIGNGDFDTPLELHNRTDLGLLAEAVNDTADRLKRAQLEKLQHDLALTEAYDQMKIHVHELQAEIKERVRTQEALRLSEEKLMQSQKMEAIGQLAGGVAHDFNNILTAINGYATLMLRTISEENKNFKYATEVRKACDRASALVRKLLAFSRKQVLAPKVINLNRIITEMNDMLKRLMTSNVKLVFEEDSGLANVKADPAEMEQVIMNLVVNARDAMPEGGRILVKTMNAGAEIDEEGNLGPVAKITVSDTGMGMDKATQSRIFEPFFTTKERGKGTGLGLSTVYGIIKQSGGRLLVDSEVGQGTTFTITLPCIEEATSRMISRDAVAGIGTIWTILVVDDEPSVLDLVETVLGKSGFSILTAKNGSEAVSIVKEQGDRIDFILTDVVMPELNGVEAHRQIRAMHPEMRIMFMSGHTGNAHLTSDIMNESVGFIQKPFGPDELVRRIQTIMHRDQAA